MNESGVNESGVSESGVNGSGVNESGVNGSGVNESAVNESGVNGSGVNESGVRLEQWARELLRCPVTGATLVDGVDADGNPVLVSTHPTDPRTYPIRDGIPILLTDTPQ